MNLLVPDDRGKCLRFRFADGPSNSGSRFGGTQPVGLNVDLRPDGQYLFTILISTSPILYVSVFQNCDFSSFIDAMNEGPQSDDRILLICHNVDHPRSDARKNECDVSPHPIVFGDIGDDIVEEYEGTIVPEPDHKIGGTPYCIQEPELLGASELFDAGYVQVLQISFPGPKDGDIHGSWPFMDGVFNLLWKEPFEGIPYFWFLQK